MVFHRGIWVEQYWKMSVINRMLGSGGKTYVPRAMYSLRISFCIVPRSSSIDAPCSSPATTYVANKTIAGALIVMDVLTLSRGIPSKSAIMSSTEEIDTPTFPTSPYESSSSASNPN